MNFKQRLKMGSMALVWVGLAVSLAFILASLEFTDSSMLIHLKVIYFSIFVLFTFVAIVYLKLFFGNESKSKWCVKSGRVWNLDIYGWAHYISCLKLSGCENIMTKKGLAADMQLLIIVGVVAVLSIVFVLIVRWKFSFSITK